LKHLLQVTILAFLSSTFAMADVILDVAVNTTPIEGVAGYLAFDFLGGTPVANNTATISGFTSDATLGAVTPSGDAAGTIFPGPGTLDDTNFFFNEFLQAVTYGTKISFTLDLTTSGSAIPDNFALYLLDSTQNPFPTSDPTGANSLFAINITGLGLTPDIYTSSSATVTITAGGSTAAPEPGSFWLAALAVLALTPLLKRRLKPTATV